MAKKREYKWWKEALNRIRFKYRLVIFDDETYEEKVTFRLSRLNVFIALGTLAIVLIFITTYIIAFTPLREYIPGYASISNRNDIYNLLKRTDSLEKALQSKDLYLLNIRNIISGKEMLEEIPDKPASQEVKKDISFTHSKEDSLLREEMAREERYNLAPGDNEKDRGSSFPSMSTFFFFTPVKGLVSNGFDPATQHFGIDVVASKNEAVKSALEGTVVFSDWTLETGYTIGVQHQQNLFSIYKHNATLLKKLGAFVKAGEPIAIIGGSGEMSTGPHLHFELWYNGRPVNPKDYVSF